MAKIRLDGVWYDWDDDTISGKRLKQQFNVRENRDIMIVTRNLKSGSIMNDYEEVPIDQNAVIQATTFPKNIHYGANVANISGNRFQNLGEREKFILAQVFQVSERYYFRNKNALMLSENCDFLVIRDFPLPPAGDWLGRNAAICVYFPNSYPRKPPLGFFVDERLQHSGKGENHLFRGTGIYTEPEGFFKKHKLSRKGYGFYCWHVEDNWSPDLSNPLKPDNLDSFLKIAYFAFDSKTVKGTRKITRIY